MKKSVVFAALFAVAACCCAAGAGAQRKIKAVYMSQERWEDVKRQVDASGRYVFWDQDAALVVTNAPEKAEYRPEEPRREPVPVKGIKKDRKGRPAPHPGPYQGQVTS